MEKIGQSKTLVELLADIKEAQETKRERQEQLKMRLFHKIISEWKQYGSVYFWQKTFRVVPYEVLAEIYNNIQNLKKEKYPFKNEAGFFVSTLKNMGYLSSEAWKRDNVKSQGGDYYDIDKRNKSGDNHASA